MLRATVAGAAASRRFCRGPGFERDHLARTGRDVPTADIVAQAGAGDAQAQDSLARYEDRLARALAHVINLLDPDVIVLGGGMSNTARLYASVPKLWGAWIFSDRVDTRLVRNAHGDSSGVRGAARLWPPCRADFSPPGYRVGLKPALQGHRYIEV